MASPPAVSDAEDLSRLEVRVAGELAGWLDYRPGGDSMSIAHTEVLDGHQGEGLGGVLVRSALDKARGAGKTVSATCPFALAYVDRHPELDEFLVPYARRRRAPD